MSVRPHRGLPLTGREITLGATTLCTEYCARLLRSLGADVEAPGPFSALDIARDWVDSGLITLTGYPEAPMQGPAALPSAARGALDALKLLAAQDTLARVNGATLLSERAAFMQLGRQGRVSANGSCHLLQAADGWLALNLARAEDWELMPAWLEQALPALCWEAVTDGVSDKSVAQLLQRGRWMGLPVAPAARPSAQPDSWFSIVASGVPVVSENVRPLVVDLSSLWAGPLCTHLLSQAGARVIKVESAARPDGARAGHHEFHELLNSGKESVVLDLRRDEGRRQLNSLLSWADIVVESSRPRALQQMGIDAREFVRSVPGLIWLSITGYGRADPMANWVAFGDDAAVAAGVAMATAEPPLFCGDALADPLTGIHAALAALAFRHSGGGVLLDLSLRDVTAYCLSFYPEAARGRVVGSGADWQLIANDQVFDIGLPERRQSLTPAASPGSDTGRILQEFGIPC